MGACSSTPPPKGLKGQKGQKEASVVTGSFKKAEVQAFLPPSAEYEASGDDRFVFFLSHRGPDTKEALVRPLAFMLNKLGIAHFFDQSDNAMKLGRENADQMAHAAWTCYVGIVIISDRFADSKWCLKELNTFLLRHHQNHTNLLLPVYYADHLMSQSKVYYPHIGMFSSIVRKSDEAAHDFLISLIPRLLTVPTIQALPSVRAAQMKLDADPFFIRRLWNTYVESLVDKNEYKKFVDPNPVSDAKEIETIMNLHKRLVPTDVAAGLDVYQPLEYSFAPPATHAELPRYSLDVVVLNLLRHNTLILGKQDVSEEKGAATKQKQDLKQQSLNRASPPTSSPAKVLLILGGAGCGKSLFGWYLCSRFHSPGTGSEKFTALPLFVSLSALRHVLLSNEPSELLPRYFLNTYAIKDASSLYERSLVFILDGLDELGTKMNLFQACRLHVWRNSTFIITCRGDFLSESDIAQYVTPINPINLKREPIWLAQLYILPFSAHQRVEYVEKFAKRYKEIYRWSAAEYLAALEKFPALNDFQTKPLLLFMVLTVLPRFHIGGAVLNETRRLNPYLLEVQPTSEISWLFPQIRLVELYSLFVEGWAEREITRLPISSQPSSKQVLDFCSELAFQMFLHSQNSVSIVEAHASPVPPPAATRAQRLAKQSSSVLGDVWAVHLFAAHENEQVCSPLRKSEDRYSFLHKSLQEFFAARHIASDLVDRVLFSSWPDLLSSSASELHLSRKRVTTDYSVLHFAAQMVDQRIRAYLIRSSNDLKLSKEQSSTLQPYARALVDILRANLDPVASSNAITILNASGVSLGGCDFSRLNLSDDLLLTGPLNPAVPTADLSGAILSRCSFVNAKLCGVRLESACLDYADFRGADAQAIVFGQSSMFLGHTDKIWSLALSSDCKLLYSSSDDKTVRQWSVDTGSLARTFTGHTDAVGALALSFDGNSLFSGSDDKTIRQWSVDTGSLARVLQGHTAYVIALVLAPDRTSLYSGSGDQTIRKWSLASGTSEYTLKGHTGSISCLALSVDGAVLFSGSYDSTIRQWEAASGSCLRVLEGHTGFVKCLAVSSDSLFSGSDDTSIRRWAVDTGSPLGTLTGHTNSVAALAVSRDGKSLFSASADTTIRHWSVDSGALVRLFEGHTDVVYSLSLSLDGTVLFSGSVDNTIRQWSVDCGVFARVLEAHSHYVYSLALSGSTLFSASEDQTIRQWSVETGSLVRVLSGHTDSIMSLALSSDSKFLFSASLDQRILQWTLDSNAPPRVLKGHTDEVYNLILSADNKTLFSASKDKTIRHWSADSGLVVRTLEGHTDPVRSLALTCDGKTLFSGSFDKTIRKWSVETGALVHVLKGHTNAVYSLVLSSDSQSLFSGSADRTIRQWSVTVGSLIRSFEGHTDQVKTLALSSDGMRLFSGSHDTTIRQWSLNSGSLSSVLVGHNLPVESLVLSPDNKTLFSCSWDRTVRQWAVSPSYPSGLQEWNSGPWVLSAFQCKIDTHTQLLPRSRLLLAQCGAVVQ